MTGIAELTGAAGFGKRAGLFERGGVENRGARGKQITQGLSWAGPIDARLRGGTRRDAHSADAAPSPERRQAGHRTHQRLADGDDVGALKELAEALPIFFISERIEIGAHGLVDVDAQGSGKLFGDARDVGEAQVV